MRAVSKVQERQKMSDRLDWYGLSILTKVICKEINLCNDGKVGDEVLVEGQGCDNAPKRGIPRLSLFEVIDDFGPSV